MSAIFLKGGGKEAPGLEFILYRMRGYYGCTPSQLDNEDFDTVLLDFYLIDGEARGQQGPKKKAMR